MRNQADLPARCPRRDHPVIASHDRAHSAEVRALAGAAGLPLDGADLARSRIG
jgi:hypothetical protein